VSNIYWQSVPVYIIPVLVYEIEITIDIKIINPDNALKPQLIILCRTPTLGLIFKCMHLL